MSGILMLPDSRLSQNDTHHACKAQGHVILRLDVTLDTGTIWNQHEVHTHHPLPSLGNSRCITVLRVCRL